ncbi:MAG: hypothetical protein HYR66_06065 [Sphingobacteriales bacterium]|nr:hypothetical protein [Sphingobacteriales bacterium]MBI3718491.1 hypothetical protein [Sphingobacteriales bacterium]
MKQRLLRPENLLFVLPVISVGLSEMSMILFAFDSPKEISNQLLGPALMVLTADIISWTLFMTIPYLLYTILRKKNLYQRKVAWIHISLSFFTFLFNLVQFDFATSVVPGWHTTIYPSSVLGISSLSNILFLLVQVGFVIYFTKRVLNTTSEAKIK